ncbi:cyanophycinase [Streptomyces sp. NPDC127584]|uniref:cyanophycinase n=1 Tax=Streptomyces sp. NPDC127584 TaxID=3345403 RepID=UPI00363F2016
MRAHSGTARRTVLAGSIALALLTTAPTAHALSERPQQPHGSLVLVGGGLKDDNKQVYGEIIKRAGGPAARIGVITAASVPESQDPHAGDPDLCSNSACNGAYYADLFKRHGAADAQWIPLDIDHVANADSDAVVAQINSMSGFFFGGGDQYRYLTTLLHGDRHTDSKVLAAIRTKLAHGAVVAGSSAGAQTASGADMVSGGESYEGLRGGSAPGYYEDPARLAYIPEGGFGFLRSGLIDTHTGAYGREGRALRLAADTGHDRVYALEENTALVVDHPGTPREHLTVLGPNGVAVLDLHGARAHIRPRLDPARRPLHLPHRPRPVRRPHLDAPARTGQAAPDTRQHDAGARQHRRLLLLRQPGRRPLLLPHHRPRARLDPRAEHRERHHLRVRPALRRHLQQGRRVLRLDR